MGVSGECPYSKKERIAGYGASWWLWLFLIFCIQWSVPRIASANWQPLAERLVADGYNEQTIRMLFSRPEVRFEPTVMAGKIAGIVRSQLSRPSVSGPLDHNGVYRSFMNERVIARARSYMRENRAILEEASAGYGVPGEVVVSILLVETRLGRSTGGAIVFNRLASMALSANLETIKPYIGRGIITADREDYAQTWCRKKSDWAYNELKALLNYAGKSGIDPLDIKGSIYGAIGLCQFMPSNIFSFGIDADNDGRVDPFVTPDAIHSIANYLRQHGWNSHIGREDRRKVIFAYNNSTVYVNTILAVADKLRGGAHAKR
ncbi:MAG: lytic murein transglycosylase [Deltaproteobacteria bacterium]|nr:lytic murein transglycosylase [Deltaproteobacteria bacterium]